jgi:hypothetical protein
MVKTEFFYNLRVFNGSVNGDLETSGEFRTLAYHMKHINHIAAVVALCLAVSALWCGDFTCKGDTDSDHCLSAPFESPGGHADASAGARADTHASHCTCICHAPSIEAGVALMSPMSSLGTVAEYVSCDITPAPGRTVFRPPAAS